MSVAAIVALMALGAAVGVVGERRAAERAERASRRVLSVLLYAVLPPVYFVLAVGLQLDGTLGAGLLLAYAELTLVGVVAWLLGTRALGLPRPSVGALVVCSILANTGYLGLPLTSALLGPDELGPAIAWDSLVSGPMFFGVAFVVGSVFAPRPEGQGGAGAAGAAEVPLARGIVRLLRTRLRVLLRNPPLWGVLLGLVAPDALAPDLAVELAEDALIGVLVVGFAVVGVQLTAETRAVGAAALAISRPVAVVLGLRLVLAPALLLLVILVVLDLPRAFVLQAAMPSGINALVVAHACRLDLRLTAAAIAWTHVVAGVVALALSLVA